MARRRKGDMLMIGHAALDVLILAVIVFDLGGFGDSLTR